MTASEKMTQNQVNERAKAYHEAQRIKALYYLWRTFNIDIAPMLGLLPAPETDEEKTKRERAESKRRRGLGGVQGMKHRETKDQRK